MWRADSRSAGLGKRLTYEFAAGLLVLLVTGVAFSWALGWAPRAAAHGTGGAAAWAQPAPHPGAVGTSSRWPNLKRVAREFNQMAEQLEQYEEA